MFPKSTLELRSDVSLAQSVPTGIVGVSLPTERGPINDPGNTIDKIITNKAQFNRTYGEVLTGHVGTKILLDALEQGAQVRVNRIVPRLTQADKNSYANTKQQFVIDSTSTVLGGGVMVVNAAGDFTTSFNSLTPKPNRLHMDVTISGLTGADSILNGVSRFAVTTGSNTAYASVAAALNALAEEITAPSAWTLASVEDTSFTITATTALRQALDRARANGTNPSFRLVIGFYNSAGAVAVYNQTATAVTVANSLLKLTVKPKYIDSSDVPYYWGVLPAQSGLADKVDILVGDTRFQAYEERIFDVPKDFTAEDLEELTDSNSYLEFTSADASVSQFRLIAKRNLNYVSDSLGTYTAGSYVFQVNDSDYIGDMEAETGVHAFAKTKDVTLFATPGWISVPTIEAYTEYTYKLGQVGQEFGGIAWYVGQMGPASSSIKQATEYFLALNVPKGSLIPLGCGYIAKKGSTIAEGYLATYMAGWSLTPTIGINYAPAGEFFGVIKGAVDLLIDATAPAFKADADYAYKLGINLPYNDPKNGICIYGIRTNGEGPTQQIPVARTFGYLKLRMLQEAPAGMFGPNADDAPTTVNRRAKLIDVLYQAERDRIIQSYTFEDGSALQDPDNPNVNEYRYAWTAIPTYSVEQIKGLGVATSSSASITLL